MLYWSGLTYYSNQIIAAFDYPVLSFSGKITTTLGRSGKKQMLASFLEVQRSLGRKHTRSISAPMIRRVVRNAHCIVGRGSLTKRRMGARPRRKQSRA